MTKPKFDKEAYLRMLDQKLTGTARPGGRGAGKGGLASMAQQLRRTFPGKGKLPTG